MRQRAPRLLFFAVVAAASFAPAAAFALDRQLTLGGDLFYAHEFIDESGPGTGAGLHVSYGLTDAVALGGTVSWAGHVVDGGDYLALRQTITASAGFYYAFDVIRVVPYLGLLMGAAVSIDGDETSAGYLLDIRGGADVIVTPSFMTGLELGYQFIVGEEILPARLVVAVRLSWRHIFF
jgi:hypothetical protein